MAKLPRDLSGWQAISNLAKICFKELRTSGSHCMIRRREKTFTIPLHDRLSVGIVKELIALLEDFGYSRQEAIRFIKTGKPLKVNCPLE